MTGELDAAAELAELRKTVEAGLPSWDMMVRHGSQLIEAGTAGRDMSLAVLRAIDALAGVAPVSTSGVQASQSAWRLANSGLGDLVSRTPGAGEVMNSMSFTGIAVSGFPTVGDLHSPLSSAAQQSLADSLRQFNDAAERLPWVETLRANLVRHGLDVAVPGFRSPVELLDEARDSFTRPASSGTSPSAVLLAIRECLDTSVERVLRRRKHHQRVKGARAKILAIRDAFALNYVDARLFDVLGHQYKEMKDLLADAKGMVMSREEIRNRFLRACAMLSALLTSIDVQAE